MDPISIVGLSASVIQISDATIKILRYLNDVRNASKEQAQVAQEGTLLLALLTSIKYRLEETDVKDQWARGVLSLGMVNGPLHQYQEALEGLAGKLHGSGGRLKTAVLWHFDKKDIEEFLRKMGRVKSLVDSALQGDILSDPLSISPCKSY